MTLSDNKRTEIENLLSNIVFNVNMDIEIFGASKTTVNKTLRIKNTR